MADELLTPAEVAKLFRVSENTVARWARSGKLRYTRTPGGRIRLYRSQVAAMVQPEEAR